VSTAAILALKNPSTRFTIVDKNAALIGSWQSNKIPVQEPGLFEIVLKVSDWHMSPDCHEDVSLHVANDPDAQTGEPDSSLHDNYRIEKKEESRYVPTPVPNLHFSTDVRGAIAAADMIFIAVNTPSKVNRRLLFSFQLTIGILICMHESRRVPWNMSWTSPTSIPCWM
jgi:UDPglucose 6-dehydrogenase